MVHFFSLYFPEYPLGFINEHDPVGGITPLVIKRRALV